MKKERFSNILDIAHSSNCMMSIIMLLEKATMRVHPNQSRYQLIGCWIFFNRDLSESVKKKLLPVVEFLKINPVITKQDVIRITGKA